MRTIKLLFTASLAALTMLASCAGKAQQSASEKNDDNCDAAITSEMAKKVEYLLSGYESDEEQYYSALYAIHNLQLPVFILDMEESGDITKEESDALFCLIKRIANHWVTIGKGVYTKSSTYTDQKSGETREVSLYIKEGDNDIMFGIPNADSIAIYMVNNEYYNDATNDLTWDNANNAVRGNITRVDEGRIKAEKMEDMDVTAAYVSLSEKEMEGIGTGKYSYVAIDISCDNDSSEPYTNSVIMPIKGLAERINAQETKSEH